MRLNLIRAYTSTRWQVVSGVLCLLTRMLIIIGPGRTPHSTQAPGRMGDAHSVAPGLYVRLLGKR